METTDGVGSSCYNGNYNHRLRRTKWSQSRSRGFDGIAQLHWERKESEKPDKDGMDESQFRPTCTVLLLFRFGNGDASFPWADG